MKVVVIVLLTKKTCHFSTVTARYLESFATYCHLIIKVRNVHDCNATKDHYHYAMPE